MSSNLEEAESCQIREFVIDEGFRDLIPKLMPDEYSRLEQSILLEGCRDALVVWNGVIIDGHNRYAICTKHNIPFQTLEKDFASREQAKTWIIENQIGRRNLEPGMRGMLVLQLKDLIKNLEKRGIERKANSLFVNSQKVVDRVNTTKSLADIAGVGEQTMSRVKKINAEGDDKLKDKLRKGEISVNKAYKTLELYKKTGAKKKEHINTRDFLPSEFSKLPVENDGLPDNRTPTAKLVGISKADMASQGNVVYDPVAAYKAAHEEYYAVVVSEKLSHYEGISKKQILQDLKILSDITEVS